MFWNWRGPRQSIENYARNHAQGMRGGPAYHWGHRAAFDHDFAGCLALLNQPVLILNPADDLAELTRRAIGQMPRGDIIELPDCGHGMLDSDTELVAQYLRQFLDDPI